jgi:Trypsin-like serine proteases, typically periplasmic, contain C-terminal PDZ domain
MNPQLKSLYILFLFLFLLSSCKKSFPEIVKETENATFIIYTYDEFGSPSGSGSGFFINKDGVGITNYHVLDESIKATIKTTDENEYEIEKVIASDEHLDIALFRIKNKGNRKFPVLKFAKKNVQKGDKVYNISSPMGLEHSVSEGIVSSFRKDKYKRDVIQVTAPISPGSSGSAILNDRGEVLAIATYSRIGGENLNFGITVNKESIDKLEKNDFVKENPKFNADKNFVILNIPSNRNPDVILNAIEFGKSVTTAYLTYTNLNLSGGDSYGVWCELNTGDDGFLIHDKDTNEKHYVISSTIGANKESYTTVPLGSALKFKVHFPAIKNIPKKIDIICGYTTRGWQFTNIDLEEYRETVNVDSESYQKEYAFSTMEDGELSKAYDMLIDLIENNPDDIHVLNALGIISYIYDNNSDAIVYFSEAIDVNPNNITPYVNRHEVYYYQGRYDEAIEDITQAIHIEPDQPDLFIYRCLCYIEKEDWEKAKKDMDHAISTEDFKNDPYGYYYRVIINYNLGIYDSVCEDITFVLSQIDDKEIETELKEIKKECNCH